MIAVDKPVLTGKRLIEDAIPIDVISRTSASEKIGGRHRPPRVSCTCGGPGARSPRPGPRSTPRWCQRTDISATPRSWRSSSTHSAAGAARSRRSARRERKYSPRTGACHPKWSTCSPAAERSRSKPPGSVARSRRIELNPVAHLIERMMLEYPQAHPGLADDVRRWGKVWVDRAWDKLADIYPPVPSAGGADDDLFGGSSGRPNAARVPVDAHRPLPQPRAPRASRRPRPPDLAGQEEGPHGRPQARRRPRGADREL